MDTSPEEKQKIREKIDALKASKFKQQTLPAWRPVPTAMSTMLTFTLFSIFFLVVGAILFVKSGEIIEEQIRYDTTCMPTGGWDTRSADTIWPYGMVNQTDLFDSYDATGKVCTTPFAADCTFKVCQDKLNVIELKEDVPAGQKLFLYYQLDNFYQNHRRYVKSRSNTQLNGGDGKLMTASDVKSDCDPVYQNSNLWENQKYSYQKVQQFTDYAAIAKIVAGTNAQVPLKPDLKATDAATPCGLIAKSLFNDTFNIQFSADADGKSGWSNIKIVEEDIAWASDVAHKFKNTPSPWKANQWWDMTDEHFIVWMRTAGLPNFRKLYGNLGTGAKKGFYRILINNQFNVKPYDGQKHFVMSTTNALGGKNYFLAICYICVGVFCALFAFIFLVVHFKRQSQQD